MLIALPSLLSSLASVALALFVLSQGPRRLPRRAFSLGLLSLFVLELGNFLALRATSPSEILFWKRISLMGEVSLPANWLLCSLVLARSNYRESLARWRPILVAVYLFSLIFLVFIPSNDFLYGSLQTPLLSWPVAIPLGRVGRLFYPFFLLGSVLILANLENTLRSSVEPKRSQVKFLLLGVGGIFALSTYLSGQIILYSQLRLDYLPLASLIHMICLGVMAFSMIRRGWFQVDVFVSRQVIYHALTFLVAGGYLLAVGLLAQGLRYLGRGWMPHLDTLFAFLTSMGLVTFFLSARHQSRIRAFIGTHFYRSKYDHRTLWQKSTEKLGSSLSAEEVLSLAKGLLMETLGVRGVGFWLYDGYRKGFYPAYSPNLSGKGEISLKEEHDLVQYLFKVNRPVTLVALRDPRAPRAAWEISRALLEETEASVWVPLVAGERSVGLMALQGVPGRKGFDHEDCELLKTLSMPIAHHLLMAQMSAELIAAKQVEALSQLSAFVLHDLKNFTSSLSLLIQNTGPNWDDPDFRADVLETISDTVARMKELINRLSVPSNTRLQHRPADLNVLISETIRKLNSTGSRITFLPSDQPLPLAELDYGEIQKVVLNLVLNAHEATSGRGEILIRTQAQNGWVSFAVADNGCGMSTEFMADSLFVPFKSTKDRGSGIGLYQCKRVIEAHRGQIEVESRPGQGSTFHVQFPAIKATMS